MCSTNKNDRITYVYYFNLINYTFLYIYTIVHTTRVKCTLYV